MSNRRFLKHVTVYGLGELIATAGGIVLLPIFTRRLTHADFGALELIERAGEILGICLLFRGIPVATIAFYCQSRSANRGEGIVSAGLLLTLVSAVVGALVLLPFAGVASQALEIGSAAVLVTALLATMLDGISGVVHAAIQARVQSTMFVVVAMSQFLVRVALSILFVVGFGWGLWGIVLASLLRSGAFALALTCWELRRGMVLPSRAIFKEMLAFALPFMPSGICAMVLNNGDRFFLLHWRGPAEVGVYGLGYRMALFVGVFSLTPLFRVWSAQMYAASEEEEAPAIFGRVATRLLAAYLFVGLCLCLFQDEVVRLFAGPSYRGAAQIIAPVALAYWCYWASQIMDAGLYIRRKTGRKVWIWSLSTVVILGLYALLIPPWGAMGAALATLGGFAFHAALTYTVSQRVFPVHYEAGRIAATLCLTVAVWLASRLLPIAPWAIPVKAGLLLLWPGLHWALGIISDTEKMWISSELRIWLNTLRGAHRPPEVVQGVPVTVGGNGRIPDDIEDALRLGQPALKEERS
jgi:O-antigen/teichoic acid export membrane protein